MSFTSAKRSLTSLRSELSYREAITPFICSTFEDFTLERQYLRDKIFPRLAVACIERGTQFLPIDLRWNDTAYKTNNSSLVLYQCFEAIEDCAPYFICLLGERYGVHRAEDLSSEEAKDTADWLQRNLETAATFAGNEWLLEEENKYCGITELEIIKASFRERTNYGYYYFRNPDKIREDSMGEDLSGRARLMEVYDSESEYAATKMKQLKQQIIDTELPVKYFKTVEELGNLVFKDWLSILEAIYPALNNNVFYASSSEEFRQWSTHEGFAKTRRKRFIVTKGVRFVQDILTRHAQCGDNTKKSRSSATSIARMSEGSFLTSLPEQDNLPSIVALFGERGCGLTATIAHWVKKFQVENPHAVMISHYVESGEEASNITSFMRRCIRELRQEYCDYNIIDYDDFLALADYNTIVEAFQASLLLGPCIVILDGLNHLSSCDVTPVHVIKTLSWLPSNLASSCRIIVSTTPSDITCKHLQSRQNVHIIHMPVLQDNNEKSKILHEWLGKHACYLNSQDTTASIHTARLSRVPLFYVALANEIRLHGPAGIPDKQLESYLIARNFSDLWTAMIRRWSHDYSWLKPTQLKNGVPMKTQVSKDRLNNGWVPDALRLISVSREGLLSQELLKILKAFGYNQKHGISPANWRMFISAAKNGIYITADGLLSFHQSSLREAVDFLLLNGLTSPSHVRHVTPFEISWEVQKFQYHSILVNSFGVFPCNQRLVHELPWQHKVAGDIIGLGNTLKRQDVLVTLWSFDQNSKNKYDFINYWKHLIKNDFDPVEIYHTMVNEAEATIVAKAETTGDITMVYGDVSWPSIRDRIIKKCGDSYNVIEVSYLAYLVGIYFLGMRDLRTAEIMLLKAFKMAHNTTSINDLDYLCRVQNALGNLYYESKLIDKAMLFYHSVLKTADQVTTYVNFNKADIVALQMNAYKKMAEIAVRQMLDSYQTLRNINIEESEDWLNKVRDMVNNATRLRDICKIDDGKAAIDHILSLLSFYQEHYEESDILLNKAINQIEELHGRSHLAIASLLQDLAKYTVPSECQITDITKKEKLYRRALEIREKKLGKSHFDVSQTLVDLGCTLQAKRTRDSAEEARYMLQRAVDMRTEELGVYHEKTKEARKTLMKYQ